MSRRTLNLFYKVVDEDRKFRWALMVAGAALGIGFAAAARILFTDTPASAWSLGVLGVGFVIGLIAIVDAARALRMADKAHDDLGV